MFALFLFLGCSNNTQKPFPSSDTYDTAISEDSFFDGSKSHIIDVQCSFLYEGRLQSICFMPDAAGDYRFCHEVAMEEHGWVPNNPSDPLLSFNEYLQDNIPDINMSYAPFVEELGACIIEEQSESFVDITTEQIVFFSDHIYHDATYIGSGSWEGAAYLPITNDDCLSAINTFGWLTTETSLYGESEQLYGATDVFRLSHQRSLSLSEFYF